MLQQHIIGRQRDTIVVHFELTTIKLVPAKPSFRSLSLLFSSQGHSTKPFAPTVRSKSDIRAEDGDASRRPSEEILQILPLHMVWEIPDKQRPSRNAWRLLLLLLALVLLLKLLVLRRSLQLSV